MNKISAVAASGVEHPHARRNVSAQNLVENINIDLSELFLYAQGHSGTFFYLLGSGKTICFRFERPRCPALSVFSAHQLSTLRYNR
jgi:hypothetical protein